jgi:hypothetical protein
MALDATTLGQKLAAQLKRDLLDPDPPPADPETAVRIMAQAIAAALVPYLTANAVVTVGTQNGTLS